MIYTIKGKALTVVQQMASDMFPKEGKPQKSTVQLVLCPSKWMKNWVEEKKKRGAKRAMQKG